MSTKATVENIESLNDAIARIRSDEPKVDRCAWMVMGHVNNNPNLVEVVGEGDTLEDLHSMLSDSQVMYGLIRLPTTFDMSKTVKFVYMRWLGDHMPMVLKAKVGVVHGSIEEHFNPVHLKVESNSIEDLKEDVLIQKLDESSGTRNKVIEGSVAGMQERGFTQHAVRAQDKGKPKSVAPGGLTVDVSESLQQALDEVRSDLSETLWVVGAFEDGNFKKPLTLVANGNGDIEELKSCLQDDLVMYGLYRTGDKFDEIATVKFVYICWIGEKVKPMMKGKVSSVQGTVERIFSPHHVAFTFTNTHDITSGVIKDKVTSSSGSKSHVR